MVLNEEQITKLVTHVGYGGGHTNPDKVELLIIGNESGTSRMPVEEYIKSVTTQVQSKEVNTGNITQRNSPFLQYIARLNLFLKDNELKWFSPKSQLNYCEIEKINQDWTDGGRVHLLDIRPLPRATETGWPYEGALRNQKDYLYAFNNFNCSDKVAFGAMVATRKQALQNEIARYKNLKLIIGAGAEHMKLKFFESMFDGIHFDSKLGVSARNVKKRRVQNVFHIARYASINKSFTVIACKFFNSSNGIGLEGLKELATVYLTADKT